MTSTYLMTVIMLPLLALMTMAGFRLLIPGEVKKQYGRISLRRFLLGFGPFFVCAFLVYMLVQSQSSIVNALGLKVNVDYTGYLVMIEGDIVSHFQIFATPLLTYITAFVYLMVFSFLMVFTFIILIYTRNLHALEEFTIAFILIYITAFPFYIFFPVTVTGHTLPNVSTLLYDLSPIIDQGVRVVDPFLDNDFPSLHAALSIMATLVIVFRTNLERYKVFSIVSTLAILFSTLYLGIHWITDLVAGALLALASYYIATRYRELIFRAAHRILAVVEKRLKIGDSIVCTKCSKEVTVIPHGGFAECSGCGERMEYHPLTYV
ncbi:MAG: phosphatase PAP2 family protein [ANME-2 cluster archaeon]|nr:phosphatase PAP2 family protein [ANME-2 cluster archaeon]